MDSNEREDLIKEILHRIQNESARLDGWGNVLSYQTTTHYSANGQRYECLNINFSNATARIPMIPWECVNRTMRYSGNSKYDLMHEFKRMSTELRCDLLKRIRLIEEERGVMDRLGLTDSYNSDYVTAAIEAKSLAHQYAKCFTAKELDAINLELEIDSIITE